MKALVTGATGFVGPHLIAHLRDSGDDVIDPGDDEGGFDVADRGAVEEAIAGSRPEVVYHLAALSDVAASWRDPIGFLRVNVEGTQNVLDAARAHGVQRVLVVGSSEEYGPSSDPLREDAPLRPTTPYGASKVAAGYLALQSFLGGGPETVRVRPFSHIGPGQTTRFLVPALAARIAAAERDGADTIKIGATSPVRDISDVRDVVRAYRLVVDKGDAGDVYNVCSGIGISVGDLAQRLIAAATRPLRLETDPALLRPVEVPVFVGDATHVREVTGWRPNHLIDDALSAVLADARAHAATHGS
jgi:GDP-4-dehydro-6-deoxy-D-mannose reductase